MEASNRVQAMFHDINSALFDRTKTGSKILDHECDEWSDKYPHIRCVCLDTSTFTIVTIQSKWCAIVRTRRRRS